MKNWTTVYADEVDGSTYNVATWIDDGWLYVRHRTLGDHNAKAGPAAEQIARTLVREMIERAERGQCEH